MQIKCDVCEKDCVCKSCQKSIDCKYSTQENCKVCVECGKYKPSGISDAIFRDIVRSGALSRMGRHSRKHKRPFCGYGERRSENEPT